MNAITIEARQDAYEVGQVAQGTLTVSELIYRLREIADAYGEDVPVVISNDRGYTYGSIDWNEVSCQQFH